MSDEPRSPGVIERMVDMASAVVRALLPGRVPALPRVHSGDALAALFTLLVIVAVVELAATGGALSYPEYRSIAGDLLFHVMAFALAIILVRKADRLPELITGALWALTLGQGLALLTSLVVETYTPGMWLLGYVLPAYLPLVLFTLAMLGVVKGAVPVLAFLSSAAVVLGELLLPDPGPPAPILPDTEAVYLLQDRLMSQEIAALAPSTEGQPETFALVGGGHPYEGVFRREVRAVGDILANGYGASDRTITLLNSSLDPMATPLLNRTNLARGLAALADRMDVEDVAILFLTSHGAPGALSTRFQGVATRDLSARDVAHALDDSGIGNVVVIVSACYSGSFVGALTAPDRLVLTAAREDRTSFGCSDEAEWTYWGEAFFKDALAMDPDPRAAAQIARDLVRTREAEQGYPPSEPQIVEGAEIGPVLDRWLVALGFAD